MYVLKHSKRYIHSCFIVDWFAGTPMRPTYNCWLIAMVNPSDIDFRPNVSKTIHYNGVSESWRRERRRRRLLPSSTFNLSSHTNTANNAAQYRSANKANYFVFPRIVLRRKDIKTSCAQALDPVTSTCHSASVPAAASHSRQQPLRRSSSSLPQPCLMNCSRTDRQTGIPTTLSVRQSDCFA